MKKMENQPHAHEIGRVENRRIAEPVLEDRSTGTRTIDLEGIFPTTTEPTSGTDLSEIKGSALGMLLDAMPVPVLVIDGWYSVVFANEACETLSANGKGLRYMPLTQLVPTGGDPERTIRLNARLVSLLEQVMAGGKPRKAKAILEINEKRIWARLHLRSIRLASQRYILLVVEDVTADKTRQLRNNREEEEMRRTCAALRDRVRFLSWQLRKTGLMFNGLTAETDDDESESAASQEYAGLPADLVALSE
jgi:hypothetical protein